MQAEQVTEDERMTARALVRKLGLAALVVGFLTLVGGWLAGIPGLILIGVVSLILAAVWLTISFHTSADPVPPAMWRYLREFFPAIIVYALFMAFAWGLIESTSVPALQWALALAPTIPIIWIVRAMLRLLLASDELEQRIQMQSIALAAAIVGLGSMVAGFLVAANLVSGEGWLLWVLPAMFLIYGIGNWWFRRRYAGE